MSSNEPPSLFEISPFRDDDSPHNYDTTTDNYELLNELASAAIKGSGRKVYEEAATNPQANNKITSEESLNSDDGHSIEAESKVPRSKNLQEKRRVTHEHSAYRGVCRSSNGKKWRAKLGKGGGMKSLYLGTFDTEDDAARAFDIATIRLRGPDAPINFGTHHYNINSILSSPTLALGKGGSKIFQKKSVAEILTQFQLTDHQTPLVPSDEGGQIPSSQANQSMHQFASLKDVNASFVQTPSYPSSLASTIQENRVENCYVPRFDEVSNKVPLPSYFSTSKESGTLSFKDCYVPTLDMVQDIYVNPSDAQSPNRFFDIQGSGVIGMVDSFPPKFDEAMVDASVDSYNPPNFQDWYTSTFKEDFNYLEKEYMMDQNINNLLKSLELVDENLMDWLYTSMRKRKDSPDEPMEGSECIDYLSSVNFGNFNFDENNQEQVLPTNNSPNLSMLGNHYNNIQEVEKISGGNIWSDGANGKNEELPSNEIMKDIK